MRFSGFKGCRGIPPRAGRLDHDRAPRLTAVSEGWLESERQGTLEAVDRDEMLRVLRAFEEEGLEYVLIGAGAMGFHGLVRATEDLDVFIRATPENVERLKRAFRAAYRGDPHVEEISAADLLGDYPAVRYYPPSGDLYFDVMTRLGKAASFDTVEAETKEEVGTNFFQVNTEEFYRLALAGFHYTEGQSFAQGSEHSLV